MNYEVVLINVSLTQRLVFPAETRSNANAIFEDLKAFLLKRADLYTYRIKIFEFDDDCLNELAYYEV